MHLLFSLLATGQFSCKNALHNGEETTNIHSFYCLSCINFSNKVCALTVVLSIILCSSLFSAAHGEKELTCNKHILHIVMTQKESKVKPQKTKIISIVAKHSNCEIVNKNA